MRWVRSGSGFYFEPFTARKPLSLSAGLWLQLSAPKNFLFSDRRRVQINRDSTDLTGRTQNEIREYTLVTPTKISPNNMKRSEMSGEALNPFFKTKNTLKNFLKYSREQNYHLQEKTRIKLILN